MINKLCIGIGCIHTKHFMKLYSCFLTKKIIAPKRFTNKFESKSELKCTLRSLRFSSRWKGGSEPRGPDIKMTQSNAF